MEKEIINAEYKEVSSEVSSTSSPWIIDELNHKKFRLLLKITAAIFILGVFLPSIGSKKFIFFSDSYSIFTGIFELFLKGNLILFIILFTILVLFPIFNFLLLWRATSLNTPHSSTLSIMSFFNKFRFAFLGFLILLLAILELGVFKKLNPSAYIYVYLFAIVSLAFLTNKVFGLCGASSLIDAGDLINSKIDSFKTTAIGFLKSLVKISVTLIVIVIAFKVITPIAYKAITQEETASNTVSKSSIPQDNSLTDREQDVYDTYNDVDTNNPNFDIGNYCLDKEKRGNLTFEECLGVAISKFFN